MSNMKCVLVWLAVMTTTFHTSQAMCWSGANDGAIKVVGIKTDIAIAGRIEICLRSQIRVVCADGWDEHAAMVACRQLFPRTGYAAASCNNSCFGRRNGKGVSGFRCNGTEATLLQCGNEINSCTQNAGVLCCIDNSTCPTILLAGDQIYPTCTETKMEMHTTETEMQTTEVDTETTELEMQTTETETQTTELETQTTETETQTTKLEMDLETPSNTDTTTPTVETSVDERMQFSSSLAALGGGLGGLCAILAILLVGVVIWFCHRRSKQPKTQERTTGPHRTFQNPTYTPISLSNTTPSVQYSSHGPRGTHSPSAAPPPSTAIYDVINEKVTLEEKSLPTLAQGNGDGIYHVLEGPQEGGQCEEGEGERGMVVGDYEEMEEGEYYLLEEEGGGEGLTYEVPIPTIPAPAQPATQQMTDTEYSTLQHK